LKAIVYIRVSMKREEMHSPEQQLYACQQYAKQHGIDIVDVVEDLDLSGRNFAKRKVSQIIERVRDGEAHVVLVWKWSRFGRNILQSQVNLAELEKAGGQLRAATEDFDTTTSAGKFSRDQMLLIADFQSNMIGDVWKDTHNRRKRDGKTHHGRQQFGYMRCPKCQRSPENPRQYLPCRSCEGILIHDPVRGPALVEVYKRWLSGEPMRSIAKDMTQRGITSVYGKEMSGTKWYQTMDTGFAAGLIRFRNDPSQPPTKQTFSSKPSTFYGWYEGKHEPLISAEMWEQYKLKRGMSAPQAARESRAKYAHSTLVHCMRLDRSDKVCTSVMSAATLKRDMKGFRCARVHESGGCKGLSVSTMTLDRETRKWLTEHATGEGAGRAAMLHAATAEKAVADVRSIREEISRIQGKRDTLLEMLDEKVVSRDDYTRKNGQYLARIEALEGKAAHLEAERAVNTVPPPEFFSALLDIWDRMEEHEKRAALTKVLRRIEVHQTEGMARNALVFVPRWAEGGQGPSDQAALPSVSEVEVLSSAS
jgi:DNA invertase Pin-like site-specific DNA recombinase